MGKLRRIYFRDNLWVYQGLIGGLVVNNKGVGIVRLKSPQYELLSLDILLRGIIIYKKENRFLQITPIIDTMTYNEADEDKLRRNLSRLLAS